MKRSEKLRHWRASWAASRVALLRHARRHLDEAVDLLLQGRLPEAARPLRELADVLVQLDAIAGEPEVRMAELDAQRAKRSSN